MKNAKASKTDLLAPLNPDGRTAATTQVLLAEESDTLRDSAQFLLEAEGYSVLQAADGFAALALLVQHRPGVVIAGIMLPRIDGYQLCALLRRNAHYRHIPMIMLSPMEGLLDETRAQLVGSNAHICKTRMVSCLIDVMSATV